jgi:hypothetical protein
VLEEGGAVMVPKDVPPLLDAMPGEPCGHDGCDNEARWVVAFGGGDDLALCSHHLRLALDDD